MKNFQDYKNVGKGFIFKKIKKITTNVINPGNSLQSTECAARMYV